MIVDRAITIPASAEDTFARVIDIPFVGACLPGASDVQETADGIHQGSFAVKVGPVKVSLDGTVAIVERDDDKRSAVLRLEGSDRQIGGSVVGQMALSVEEEGEGSRLNVHTDVTISGKLGQFGQAVILKKADQITDAFVCEFSQRVREDRDLDAQLSAVASVDTADQTPAAAPVVDPDLVASSTGATQFKRTDQTRAPRDLHAIVGLLRQGRELAIVSSPDDLHGRAAPGQLWLTAGAVEAGVSSGQIGTRSYIVSVQFDGAIDVHAEWGRLVERGLGLPVAIAMFPTAQALSDPAALAAGMADLGSESGRPVIPVATTPWGLASYAAIAASGEAPAVAIDTGSHLGWDVSALVRMAVADVRRAGVRAPIIGGPVRSSHEVGLLRKAGADAVLTSLGRTGPMNRAVKELSRWYRR